MTQTDEFRARTLLLKLGWNFANDGNKPRPGITVQVFTQGGIGQAAWNGQEWLANGIILPDGIVWFWQNEATRLERGKE